MTALLVVLLVVAFLIVDLAVRAVARRLEDARVQRERRAVLAKSVRLEFAGETRSLKRAEVPRARARILAVDDEPIVLDSFRKILVLAGFSVDTVESGPEALSLVRERNYDFVFTDLKMPVMDGIEVVRAVKHLRPDADVAVITGYATIESAVETMKDGAVDYVQKPFTEDELVAFANRLLIRREARLEAERRPTVRVVAPEVAEVVAARDYCVPGGAFLSTGHTWARIDPSGRVVVGLDDFARKAVGKVERIELPPPGTVLRSGEAVCTLRRGSELLRLASPLSGTVTLDNADLKRDVGLLSESPYDRGWLCALQPSDLAEELPGLRIGRALVDWYQDEIARLRRERDGAGERELSWAELQRRFFAPPRPREVPAAPAEAVNA
jgi:CheY-like chemotaxis protein